MNGKGIAEILTTTTASIIIGSFALLYYLASFCKTLITSFFSSPLRLLFLFIFCSIFLYIYGTLMAFRLLSCVLDCIESVITLVYSHGNLLERAEKRKENSESLYDLLLTFVLYFIMAAVIFSVTADVGKIISNTLSHIKLVCRSYLMRLKNPNLDTTCSICLNNQAKIFLDCNHAFHLTCIEKWKEEKKTCPLCRAPILT